MFILEKLPFDKKDLEPHISANTLDYHHGKHHQAYVNKANKLIVDTGFNNKSLEEVIIETKSNSSQRAIFNNTSQIFNHDFFWKSLKPKTIISDRMKKLIEVSFGDLEGFKRQFKEATLDQFGSGWIWLVKEGELLKIIKTNNADTVLGMDDIKPLLNIDVWEHAYYLDYQNRRADFSEAIINNLLNWEFADNNL